MAKKFKTKAENQPKEVASSQKSPQAFFKQIVKREHADHEQFDTKSFPFDELIPRWKGGQFDPHFMNAATGRTFGNQHHTKGEGTKKRSDFERFDFAFCLEWIDRTVDGVTFRDRCYNQFTIKSQGCHSHPRCEFKDGPNKVYYQLLRGEPCNWGMLKGSEASAEDVHRKAWIYTDWYKYALERAQQECDLADNQGEERPEDLVSIRLAEFDDWWKSEVKKDKQQGGAQAAASRGYSLIGTQTQPPAFMSRVTCGTLATAHEQADAASAPGTVHLPVSNMLSGPPQVLPSGRVSEAPITVSNNRHRFGKNTTDGRPDLEAKRTRLQNQKGKKPMVVKSVAGTLSMGTNPGTLK